MILVEEYTMGHGAGSCQSSNLIRVYAGNDNIPCTADDWFTYAPNFRERINVKLEIR